MINSLSSHRIYKYMTESKLIDTEVKVAEADILPLTPDTVTSVPEPIKQVMEPVDNTTVTTKAIDEEPNISPKMDALGPVAEVLVPPEIIQQAEDYALRDEPVPVDNTAAVVTGPSIPDTHFVKQLEFMVNYYSIENESNTPDYILAKYIRDCLDAYNNAIKTRDGWHGYKTLAEVYEAVCAGEDFITMEHLKEARQGDLDNHKEDEKHTTGQVGDETEEVEKEDSQLHVNNIKSFVDTKLQESLEKLPKMEPQSKEKSRAVYPNRLRNVDAIIHYVGFIAEGDVNPEFIKDELDPNTYAVMKDIPVANMLPGKSHGTWHKSKVDHKLYHVDEPMPPLVVKRLKYGKYKIMDGNRRHLRAKQAKIKNLPAYVLMVRKDAPKEEVVASASPPFKQGTTLVAKENLQFKGVNTGRTVTFKKGQKFWITATPSTHSSTLTDAIKIDRAGKGHINSGWAFTYSDIHNYFDVESK